MGFLPLSLLLPFIGAATQLACHVRSPIGSCTYDADERSPLSQSETPLSRFSQFETEASGLPVCGNDLNWQRLVHRSCFRETVQQPKRRFKCRPEESFAMDAIGNPQIYSREYTRLVARAWDRMIAAYPIGPTEVRDLVLDSWRRCQAFGVNPGQRAAEIPGTALDGYDHRQLRMAVQASLPPIATYLSETRSVLIASDASGILLAVEGDHTLTERLACNHAVPGAAWHEHQIGTNAVGTALALCRPVQIHGQEHFCEAGKPWSCTAAPIHDPADGSVLGVIDVTGPASTALTHAGAFVMAMAERIHAMLTQYELLARVRLFELYADNKPHSGEVVLLDRRGRVVKATPGARIEDASLQPGQQLPGINADRLASGEFPQLPDTIRREWLTPLADMGECVGAILRLPSPRAGQPASTALAPSLQAIFDTSPSLGRLLALAQRYAAARTPLLLQGETGAGKDLLAVAIHRASPDPDSPFVAVNCAALPRELIASELFGYVDGAFTGARRGGARGRFEQAHNGTLFLDEIGDMPLDLQPYLLRAVEEQQISRLGDSMMRSVDVRVIAATNRPLALEVAAGRFRADLFYRLNGAVVSLPPLRERLEDLPWLVPALLRQIAPDVTADCDMVDSILARLRAHDWPGNVRELRSVLARMVLLSPDGRLDPAMLALDGPGSAPKGKLHSQEKIMILAAMTATHGSVRQAAQALGISRATLYRRLTAYRQDERDSAGTAQR
jgi:sigma-54 dependent transcriptional regulator, acetoin dehydrogenase operon transcriptional activator AcoR